MSGLLDNKTPLKTKLKSDLLKTSFLARTLETRLLLDAAAVATAAEDAVGNLPQVTAFSNETAAEDISSVFFTGGPPASVSDAEGGLLSAVVSVDWQDTTDGNGAFISFNPAGAITVLGNSSDEVTLLGTEADINATLASGFVVPGNDLFGTLHICLVVTDADGNVAVAGSTIELTPVSDVAGPAAFNDDISGAIDFSGDYFIDYQGAGKDWTGATASGSGNDAAVTLTGSSIYNDNQDVWYRATAQATGDIGYSVTDGAIAIWEVDAGAPGGKILVDAQLTDVNGNAVGTVTLQAGTEYLYQIVNENAEATYGFRGNALQGAVIDVGLEANTLTAGSVQETFLAAQDAGIATLASTAGEDLEVRVAAAFRAGANLAFAQTQATYMATHAGLAAATRAYIDITGTPENFIADYDATLVDAIADQVPQLVLVDNASRAIDETQMLTIINTLTTDIYDSGDPIILEGGELGVAGSTNDPIALEVVFGTTAEEGNPFSFTGGVALIDIDPAADSNNDDFRLNYLTSGFEFDGTLAPISYIIRPQESFDPQFSISGQSFTITRLSDGRILDAFDLFEAGEVYQIDVVPDAATDTYAFDGLFITITDPEADVTGTLPFLDRDGITVAGDNVRDAFDLGTATSAATTSGQATLDGTFNDLLPLGSLGNTTDPDLWFTAVAGETTTATLTSSNTTNPGTGIVEVYVATIDPGALDAIDTVQLSLIFEGQIGEASPSQFPVLAGQQLLIRVQSAAGDVVDVNLDLDSAPATPIFVQETPTNGLEDETPITIGDALEVTVLVGGTISNAQLTITGETQVTLFDTGALTTLTPVSETTNAGVTTTVYDVTGLILDDLNLTVPGLDNDFSGQLNLAYEFTNSAGTVNGDVGLAFLASDDDASFVLVQNNIPLQTSERIALSEFLAYSTDDSTEELVGLEVRQDLFDQGTIVEPIDTQILYLNSDLGLSQLFTLNSNALRLEIDPDGVDVVSLDDFFLIAPTTDSNGAITQFETSFVEFFPLVQTTSLDAEGNTVVVTNPVGTTDSAELGYFIPATIALVSLPTDVVEIGIGAGPTAINPIQIGGAGINGTDIISVEFATSDSDVLGDITNAVGLTVNGQNTQVVTVTGTVDDINAALAASYRNDIASGGIGRDYTVSVTAFNDVNGNNTRDAGDSDNSQGTVFLRAVAPANQAPELVVSPNLSVDEGNAYSFTGYDVTDADDFFLSLEVESDIDGIFTITGPIMGQIIPLETGPTLEAEGFSFDFAGFLPLVTYETTDVNYNGPVELTFTLGDGINTVIETVTINVNPVNDPATVIAQDAQIERNFFGAPMVTPLDIQVIEVDLDEGQLYEIELQAAAAFAFALDGIPAGVQVVGNGTNNFVVSGAIDTLTALQQAFDNGDLTAELTDVTQVGDFPITITYTQFDGQNNITETVMPPVPPIITVTNPLNTTPTFTGQVTEYFRDEADSSFLLDDTGVFDPEVLALNSDILVEIEAQPAVMGGFAPVVIATANPNVTITPDGPNIITLQGELADVNSVLETVQVLGPTNVIASDTNNVLDFIVTITVDDLENIPAPNDNVNSTTLNLFTIPGNVAPTLNFNLPSVTENSFATFDNSVFSVGDADNDQLTFTVVSSLGGLSQGASGSTNTITITGTADQINLELQNNPIVYTPDPHDILSQTEITATVSDASQFTSSSQFIQIVPQTDSTAENVVINTDQNTTLIGIADNININLAPNETAVAFILNILPSSSDPTEELGEIEINGQTFFLDDPNFPIPPQALVNGQPPEISYIPTNVSQNTSYNFSYEVVVEQQGQTLPQTIMGNILINVTDVPGEPNAEVLQDGLNWDEDEDIDVAQVFSVSTTNGDQDDVLSFVLDIDTLIPNAAFDVRSKTTGNSVTANPDGSFDLGNDFTDFIIDTGDNLNGLIDLTLDVTVTSDSGDTATDQATANIEIASVNDPATVTVQDVQIERNFFGAPMVAPLDIQVIEVDLDQGQLYEIELQAAAAFAFALDGIPAGVQVVGNGTSSFIASGTIDTLIDLQQAIDNGDLTIELTDNTQSGPFPILVTYTQLDGQNNVIETVVPAVPPTVTITDPLNTTPTILGPTIYTRLETEGTFAIDQLTVFDPEVQALGAPIDVRLTLNNTVLSGGNISFDDSNAALLVASGSGTNEIVIQGDLASVNAALATVVVTLPTQQIAPDVAINQFDGNIIVAVNDLGTISAPNSNISVSTFTLESEPVNRPPELALLIDNAVEDTPLTIGSTSFPTLLDPDGDTLTLSLTNFTSGGVTRQDGLQITGTASEIFLALAAEPYVFTPAADDASPVSFTFTLSDGLEEVVVTQPISVNAELDSTLNTLTEVSVLEGEFFDLSDVLSTQLVNLGVNEQITEVSINVNSISDGQLFVGGQLQTPPLVGDDFVIPVSGGVLPSIEILAPTLDISEIVTVGVSIDFEQQGQNLPSLQGQIPIVYEDIGTIINLATSPNNLLEDALDAVLDGFLGLTFDNLDDLDEVEVIVRLLDPDNVAEGLFDENGNPIPGADGDFPIFNGTGANINDLTNTLQSTTVRPNANANGQFDIEFEVITRDPGGANEKRETSSTTATVIPVGDAAQIFAAPVGNLLNDFNPSTIDQIGLALEIIDDDLQQLDANLRNIEIQLQDLGANVLNFDVDFANLPTGVTASGDGTGSLSIFSTLNLLPDINTFLQNTPINVVLADDGFSGPTEVTVTYNEFNPDSSLAEEQTISTTVNVVGINRAPEITLVDVTINENESGTLVVTVSDPDGDAYSGTVVLDSPVIDGVTVFDQNFTANTTPGSNLVTFSGSGAAPVTFQINFTPDTNFFGTIGANGDITDGELTDTDPGTITVLEVDAPPVITIESITLDEDQSGFFLVSTSDPDGDNYNGTVNIALADVGNINIVSAVNEAGSNANVNAFSGSLVTFSGSAPATFRVNFTLTENFNGIIGTQGDISANGDQGSATGTITINPVQDAPDFVVEDVTVQEDGSGSIVVLVNDADGETLNGFVFVDLDPNDPELTITNVENISGSTATLTQGPNGVEFEGDGVVRFRIDFDLQENFSGVLNVIGEVTDGTDLVESNSTITVTPENDAPVITIESITLDEDQSGFFLVNTSDPDGDNYNGTVNIALADVGNINIVSAVNEAGSNANVSAFSGSLVTFSGSAPATFRVNFTLTENFNGTIGTQGDISDGDLSSSASGTIDVLPVDDAPTVVVEDVTVQEGGAGVIEVFIVDPDGDDLFGNIAIGDPSDLPLTITNIEEDLINNVTITQGVNGVSFEGGTTASFRIEFQMDDDFNGTIPVFGDVVGGLEGSVIDATITVTPENDAPQIDVGDLTLNEDQSGFFLVTVSDPDGDNYSGTISFPAAGDLPLTVVSTAVETGTGFLASNSSEQVNFSGSSPVTFRVNVTFDENFNGNIPIQGNISDGQLTGADTGTITVLAIDDPLELTAFPSDTRTILEDATENVSAGTTLEDVDGTDQDTTATYSANNGTFTVTNDDDAVTTGEGTGLLQIIAPISTLNTLFTSSVFYTPDLNFTGADTITVTFDDGVDTITRTITIDITPVDDDPAQFATFQLNDINILEDATTFGISENITLTDPDGNSVVTLRVESSLGGTISETGAAANNVTVNGNEFTGTISDLNAFLAATVLYTPGANVNGTDTITVTIIDGADTTSDTFDIIIAPVNDPVAIDQLDDLTVNEDELGLVNLMVSDADDTDMLTATLSVTNGVLLVDGMEASSVTITDTAAAINAKTIQYRGNANFNGADTLTVDITDGSTTATDTAAITVDAVNDAPVFTMLPGATIETDVDTAVTISTIQVADPDGDVTAEMTFDLLNGTVNILSTANLVVMGANTQSLTITGFISDLNAALAVGLEYTPNAGFAGEDMIAVAINDLGNIGGDPLEAMAVISLDVIDDNLPDEDMIVFGTRRADTIVTGNGDDIVFAGNGNDDISTNGGNDIIFAGNGNDDIDAGSGDDLIFAGRGSDDIDAGSGDDIVFGQNGSDNIDGGEGNDLIFGGRGSDTINAGSGDDVVFAGSGSDTIIVDFNPGDTNFIHGGGGNDTLIINITQDQANDSAIMNALQDLQNDLSNGNAFNSTLGLTLFSINNLQINIVAMNDAELQEDEFEPEALDEEAQQVLVAQLDEVGEHSDKVKPNHLDRDMNKQLQKFDQERKGLLDLFA